MLGYVMSDAQGAADRLLTEVAARLARQGWVLAGVVQHNTEHDPDRPCHMDLEVLPAGPVIRISQNLGSLSQGCRLDTPALEQAAGLVEARLATGPRLLMVNKFGKRECEGGGFRPLIGRALLQGVPVLTSVKRANLTGFEAFAEGMAVVLPAEAEAVLRWCQETAAARA